MGDKETLGERVNALLVNPDVISEIGLFDSEMKPFIGISNVSGSQKSLQIYATITGNDSMITPEAAEGGLRIYGEEFVAEAKAKPGMHKSIDALLVIARGKEAYHSHVVTSYSAKPIPARVRLAMPEIAKRFGTPVHVYDEIGTRETCRRFKQAFSWVPGPGGFRNFFAVKACPNPRILDIVKEEGMGGDCSSFPELLLSRAVGMSGEDMIFTSNDTPDNEFVAARGLGAIMNLDDVTHIAALERATGGLPDLICFRYNPGNKCDGNSIIGNPVEAKYGLTHEQIFQAYHIAREKGVKRFGLHTMMASNERNPQTLVRQAEIMFNLTAEIQRKLGISFEFINLGGGIGTPYKPWDREVNLDHLAERIQNSYEHAVEVQAMFPSRIVTECGRAITGPHGWLLTEARHVMLKHRDFVGVDATMADLMRPGMYGAYHHLTVLGKEQVEHDHVYDVVGSLCEGCDKFAVQRFLPEIVRGDLIAIHNSGAHGRAMCFNYNGKNRSGEVLVRADGELEMIRRHETSADQFATFNFPESKYAHLASK